MLGNVNSHLSSKRRASLSNDMWEHNGKELFGQKFEQRLKQRSETEKAIPSASFTPKVKQFFFLEGHSLVKTVATRRCDKLHQDYTIQRSILPTIKAIQGKGQSDINFHLVNSPNPVKELSSVRVGQGGGG